MRKGRSSTVVRLLLGVIGFVLWFSWVRLSEAQQGANDVYDPNGKQQASSAFIDASMFLTKGPGTDICDAIYKLLTNQTSVPYPAAGAVIDARGFTTALTCVQGSPWSETGLAYANVPSTILLPAGTINIPPTWVLPNGTRVIGESSTNPFNTGSVVPQTTIQASSSLTGTMIQFCSSVCSAVTVEDLTLSGNAQGINGIVNSNAQELSYAKNVTMYQVLGTGLPGAPGSRPFVGQITRALQAVPPINLLDFTFSQEDTHSILILAIC